MIKEEFLQPLPLCFSSPQQVFVDVKFVNKQRVLNPMNHHTDLKKKRGIKTELPQYQYLTLWEKHLAPFTSTHNGIDINMEKTMTAITIKSGYNELMAVTKV
jgi:hypothetical protein